MKIGKKGSARYLYDSKGNKIEEQRKVANMGILSHQTQYCDNFIFEDGVLKRILVEGGFIYFGENDTTYHYFLKDHLGSNRAVVNMKTGEVAEQYDYYPFGKQHGDYHTGYIHPYRYNGKELDEIGGLDWLHYGARMMEPEWGRFTTPDPLAEKYYDVSPYAYCGNNPIKYIDPDGKEWFLYSIDGVQDPTWNWRNEHEFHTGQYSSSGEEVILPGYEAVVDFVGYYNETLGDKENMNSQDAVLADVTVYGPHGPEDVQHYKGYSMSSNPSRYGVVADGDYSVNRVDKLGPYNSPWAINNRGKVPELSNFNPRWPDRNPAYLTGVFIHRANNNGWAGEFKKNGSWHGVSEGCLLIHPSHWGKFNEQLKSVSNYHLKIRRK